jgi:uncharacterized protein YpuA (DUF1002 family)
MIKNATMKPAVISEIKQELTTLSAKELLELCLQLAKYKKDNKELLSYLLFEAHDVTAFVAGVKEEIDLQFGELPKPNIYLTKKSLRKILRSITKYIRYTSTAESAIEMLIHFCVKLKSSGIPFQKHQLLLNMYNQQLKKIHSLIDTLHEDLAYDYKKKMEKLSV